jgi:hypothetical protein
MDLLRPVHTAVNRRPFRAAVVVLSVGVASPAAAQERPFTIPRPWTQEPGTVRLEAGASLTPDRRIPLSGIRGDLLEIPAALIVGLASGVEARVEGVAWQRMSVESVDTTAALAEALALDGGSTQDAGDFSVAARVRLLRTGSSQAALQAGVRLPLAGNESGLGRDVTDFAASLLAGHRRGALRLAGEAGFAILGSPTRTAAQNDQVRLGALVEIAPPEAAYAVGLEGRTAFGDEGIGNEIVPEAAAGGRLRVGTVWLDGALRWLFPDEGALTAFQIGATRTF